MDDIELPTGKIIFPKQREFLQAGKDKKTKIAIGSTRCGKSFALAIEAVRMAVFAPEGALLFVGKTLATVHTNICEVIRDAFGAGYISKTTTRTKECTLLGRKVYCHGADDASEAERIKGRTVSGIICDEVTTYPKSVFMMILTRLDKIGARMIGSTNPESTSHWLKKILDTEGCDIETMRFTLDDNPLADEEYKKFLLTTLTGAYLKRYYYGEWAAAEGIIYSDFGESHIGEYSDLASDQIICGIDFGLQHKTEAVMVCSSHLNNPKIWVSKALSIDQNPHDVQTVSEVAEAIVDWMAPVFPSCVYVDPSALVLKTELMRRLPRGVAVLNANNDVLNGIHFICRLFSCNEIGIDKECHQLIKELYSYCWDEKKSERLGKDEVKKADDDGVDALRYALYTHFGHMADPVSEAKKRGDEVFKRNARSPYYKNKLRGYNGRTPLQDSRSYF